MIRKTVNSQHSPRAIGPYSHAVWAGKLLFLSGQLPVDAATMELAGGDITAQTKTVFDNMEAVLKDAGLTLDDVVKTTVYLASMKDFAGMNAVYQSRFNAPYPARMTVAVSGLPLGAMVEIELIAKLSDSDFSE
ncbi:MAG: RidA family protein [Victivallales bacterium]|jgi:2-iminobutanoate/2-iminopropanoate deaminase